MCIKNALEQLTNRNPGLDFVIKDIRHATKYTNTVLNHITEKVEHETYDLPSVCKFGDLEEQETMTTLFCELMAWATEGAIDMARGRCASDNIEWAKKVVGFDQDLKQRLSDGAFIP